MGKEIKNREFFTRKAEEVACDLLGKFICYKNGKVETRYQIIETEAYYHDEKDNDGKLICYGADKTKDEAKSLVSAPLFEQPGTWCIYGGQLLLSVTNDEHPDNVLIKIIKDTEGKVYTPDEIARTLHLYRVYSVSPLKCENKAGERKETRIAKIGAKETAVSLPGSCTAKQCR